MIPMHTILTSDVRKSLEETNKTVLEALLCKDTVIEELRDELKTVKDAKYKDEELARMKEFADRVTADANRGFPITEKEDKAVRQWQKNHIETQHGGRVDMGCIGGLWKYVFIPTSIGVLGVCECSLCHNRVEEETRMVKDTNERMKKRAELLKKYDAEIDFQEI